MDGPVYYRNGSTEVVKTCRTIIIPHLVILLQDYLNPTVEQGEGWGVFDIDRLFQIAITYPETGADASALETTKPAALAQNSNLIRHQLELLQ